MSDRKGIPSGHGEEVDQLAEVAQEFWSDDAWAISQTLWTDGDSNAYAYLNQGESPALYSSCRIRFDSALTVHAGEDVISAGVEMRAATWMKNVCTWSTARSAVNDEFSRSERSR